MILKKVFGSKHVDVRCLDFSRWSPVDTGSKESDFLNQIVSWKQLAKTKLFVMNEYLDHESSHGTDLELKIRIRALDCLNIKSTALPGCPFVARQGPWISIDIHVHPWIISELVLHTGCEDAYFGTGMWHEFRSLASLFPKVVRLSKWFVYSVLNSNPLGL